MFPVLGEVIAEHGIGFRSLEKGSKNQEGKKDEWRAKVNLNLWDRRRNKLSDGFGFTGNGRSE